MNTKYLSANTLPGYFDLRSQSFHLTSRSPYMTSDHLIAVVMIPRHM